jgi:hypothetical protein
VINTAEKDSAQHELFATGAEVHILDKRITILQGERSGAAEYKYPCCIKLHSVMCNPLRQNKTMRRLFQIALLFTFVSCGQSKFNNKTPQKDTSLAEIEHSKKDTNVLITKRKHQTFNENIDTLPEILKNFIPKNYSAINVSSGDANKDGLEDRILILRKISEETTSSYEDDKPDKRPFLLLLGKPDDTYELAIRNDNAVYCIDCGGVFGDPFIGTAIKNGYFSIEHGIAGGQHWQQVTTFKFDKVKGNWFLYKDHFISYKLNDSNDENADALVKDADKVKTEKNFGVVPFDKFNIYSDRGY